MAIKHRFYYEDISVADLVRKMRDVLVSIEPKPGRMWELMDTTDAEPANSMYAGPIVFVLRKPLMADNSAYIYAKIMFKDNKIISMVSPTYETTTDRNPDLNMTGFATNHLEADTNGGVRVYNKTGALVANGSAPVPTVHLPSGFDPATMKLAKAWLIRKLGPLFDEVNPRKNTDIFAWCSFCTAEVGDTPLETFGYYQHFGFGVAGEQTTPDTLLENGTGMFVVAGSFSNSASRADATSTRVFPGGGPAGDNTGTLVCVGDYDTYRTWFYANTAYGQVRPPFDDDILVGGQNVGFDFTEMCKLSPYSGVRVLTPSYIFGMYDNLYRILMRLPVYYTSLEGLYAGDIISQDVDGTLRSYMLFPFWRYRCLGVSESKRGLAILIPPDEEV